MGMKSRHKRERQHRFPEVEVLSDQGQFLGAANISIEEVPTTTEERIQYRDLVITNAAYRRGGHS